MTQPGAGFEAVQPGLKGEARLVVTEEQTARHLGSGAVPVLATPQMVLLMEQAAVAAADHLLPDGYRTVGAHLNVRHLAPTPVGFEVRARAELIQLEGRQLTFRVQAHEEPFDEDSLVGEGTHRRVIIHARHFSQRVAQKVRANS